MLFNYYIMIIKLDKREQELITHINNLILSVPSFKDLKVVVENLHLGDIIISDDIDEKLIIERKSVNDLLSSIKDGRYEEQSYRLNGLEHHNHNIIYLIEGDVNKMNRFNSKVDKTTLYSAIFSLNYYKGFSVIRTFNIEETALFICNSTCKMIKSKKNAYYQNNQIINQNNNQINNQNNNNLDEESKINEEENNKIEKTEETQNTKNYINVIKKVKKDNITPDNVVEIMLCQIPGISSVTAIAIMDKFKSLDNLLRCIQDDEKCMKDISYINTKGQTRKINKNCLETISKFLIKK
jgi:ERCC4-type nuclease